MLTFTLPILSLFLGLVTARPAPSPAPAPSYPASCTVTSVSDLVTIKKDCTNISIGTLTVPAGKTLDLDDLQSGTTVTFTGVVTFGYMEWAGPLLSVRGTNIKIVGASGSVLNGDGARWWDGKGGNGGKKKPKFFSAHGLSSSSITGITLKNAPVHGFSIANSDSLTLSSITVDNKDGDTGGGHNTDAFDVGSSSGVTITGAKVYNQDDCLAVNSGTNIKFLNCYCSGGHGISIGSVGGRSKNEVNGVTIKNCTVVDSDNGIRVKTISGASGSVTGVSYSGITLKNITKYGIIVQQDYLNGRPTGTPTGGVPITDLTISDVEGTVASKGTNVHILCAQGACSGWKWSGISVTGGKNSTSCAAVPSGAGC